MNRALAVRAASVYLPLFVSVAACAWRRPSPRDITGAVMAALWNLPVILAIHLLALRFGWWIYEADGGLLLGMPVDLFLAWAWFWGAVPALLFRSTPVIVVAVVMLIADAVLMPAASPVVQLGPSWMIGDTLALLAGVVPSQLLARWTARDRHLYRRVFLQVIVFAGVVLFVVPAVAIDASGTLWINPLRWPPWQLSLVAQLLALPAIVGLGAVQEFALRGGGTPFPYDAPARLVTSGLYGYVRNPMQISGIVLLLLVGAAVQNVWVAVAGLMAHLYSSGFAGWNESEDLDRRFGPAWRSYRAAVTNWIPRLRPWHPDGQQPARLYVDSRCGMCAEVGRWFASRGARSLQIVDAATHPRVLTRITYETSDGSMTVNGIEAVARALEHVHLGWALIAAAIRLPPVLPVVQLIADASGANPRELKNPQNPLPEPTTPNPLPRTHYPAPTTPHPLPRTHYPEPYRHSGLTSSMRQVGPPR